MILTHSKQIINGIIKLKNKYLCKELVLLQIIIFDQVRNIYLCLLAAWFFSTGLKAQGKNGLISHKLPGTRSIMLSAIGPAYCFGDIGGDLPNQVIYGLSDWNINDTRFLVSLGLRHVFPNNFGIKATAYYGNFTGSDKGTDLKYRLYSFKNNIFEFTAQGEYVLLGGPYSKRSTPHTLYLYVGVGIVHSRAKLSHNDTTITAPPKDPARQVDKVDLIKTSPVIPFGIGYQYQFTSKFSLGTEFGYHYIFSDYVDGLKPPKLKGNTGSINNDVLVALSFTFTYKISITFPSEDKCNCLWY